MDDSTVRIVGDFGEVLAECGRAKYQPVQLLYERLLQQSDDDHGARRAVVGESVPAAAAPRALPTDELVASGSRGGGAVPAAAALAPQLSRSPPLCLRQRTRDASLRGQQQQQQQPPALHPRL